MAVSNIHRPRGTRKGAGHYAPRLSQTRESAHGSCALPSEPTRLADGLGPEVSYEDRCIRSTLRCAPYSAMRNGGSPVPPDALRGRLRQTNCQRPDFTPALPLNSTRKRIARLLTLRTDGISGHGEPRCGFVSRRRERTDVVRGRPRLGAKPHASPARCPPRRRRCT